MQKKTNKKPLAAASFGAKINSSFVYSGNPKKHVLILIWKINERLRPNWFDNASVMHVAMSRGLWYMSEFARVTFIIDIQQRNISSLLSRCTARYLFLMSIIEQFRRIMIFLICIISYISAFEIFRIALMHFRSLRGFLFWLKIL